MNNVVTLSEIYRRQTYVRQVPEGGAMLVSFTKWCIAVKRLNLLKEYSEALMEVEYECTRLIFKRRHNAPFSESLARRRVAILREYTDDVKKFLIETSDDTHDLLYVGAAQEETDELYKEITLFARLPNSYNPLVGDHLSEIERRIVQIRNALTPILPQKGYTLPLAAYTL